MKIHHFQLLHFTIIYTLELLMSVVFVWKEYYVRCATGLHSVISHWELNIPHGGNIYTMKLAKHYKSGLDLVFC